MKALKPLPILVRSNLSVKKSRILLKGKMLKSFGLNAHSEFFHQSGSVAVCLIAGVILHPHELKFPSLFGGASAVSILLISAALNHLCL